MSTFCFSVESDSVPSTLPRVLEVFAMHDLVPDACYCVCGASGLSMDLQLSGIDAAAAALLAKRLGRVVTVTSVLFSPKCGRAAAA